MSAKQGAALHNFNNELVKCLEDLCEKRAKLKMDISQEEKEKANLESEIKMLQDNLEQVRGRLNQKMKILNQYEQTIQQTQDDYTKIVESSQILLSVVKKEAQGLQKPKPQTFRPTSGQN